MREGGEIMKHLMMPQKAGGKKVAPKRPKTKKKKM